MPGGRPATFLYDFNSPYAYLAAARVDTVLPGAVTWQPIAFAFLLRAHAREPWSFDPATRELGMRECERRAREYGLPPLRWPPGWPVESYGLASLRGAILAADHGRLREFSRAAFARAFVSGAGLKQPDDVVEVAAAAGIDAGLMRNGLGDPAIKARLTEATDAALARGVVGVPTVLVGEQRFWGDDQLEAAAAAAGA